MSLSVQFVRTLPLFPNGVFLQWTLVDAIVPGPYPADLYRSGGLSGPWTQIASALTAQPSFTDVFPETVPSGSVGANELSLGRALYYRVVITPPAGPPVEVISPVEPQLDQRQRLLKRKFLRDEAVMLRKLNGVEVAVLKRLHWGVRCPRCVDKYTRDSMRGACTTCYGTAYLGGYWAPTITLARRGTTPKQVGVTPQGKAEISTTTITMLDAPQVQDDDLLVFLRDSKRFLIKRVAPTELRTVTVHQRVEVSELPRTDIAYRVNVDPSAQRLF